MVAEDIIGIWVFEVDVFVVDSDTNTSIYGVSDPPSCTCYLGILCVV
jgi:hypothetical protein